MLTQKKVIVAIHKEIKSFLKFGREESNLSRLSNEKINCILYLFKKDIRNIAIEYSTHEIILEPSILREYLYEDSHIGKFLLEYIKVI